MKLSTLTPLLFVLFFALISLSNRGGRAGSQDWGNTGAPGDQTFSSGQSRTCVSCHNSSSAIQVTLEIAVKDDMGNSIENDGYVPGQTYDVSVTINPTVGSPAGYGFQLVALNGDDGVDASDIPTWSNLAGNVQMAKAANTGRTYVEQNGLSTSNEFTMKWTAPDTLTGPVTFYAGGNGVDGNSRTSGDGAALNKVTISQNDVSSTTKIANSQLTLFPNPVGDYLSVQAAIAGEYDLHIYDLTGRLVQQQKVEVFSDKTAVQTEVTKLVPGTYVVQLRNEHLQLNQRLVKL